MTKQVISLDPATYSRHFIHAGERTWVETNCYVDVWIELLHAWGFDPVAALPFTLTIDFERDQWTFFKYSLADLYDLYSLDVQELALWRPLVNHLEQQVGAGRPVLVELDSYYLPDTAGTAYQNEHVKTTVAVVEIDPAAQRLGYFHGQGYYHLRGDDFVNVLRLVADKNTNALPPYAEFVKRRDLAPPRGEALTQASLGLLKRQLRLLPETNPFEKFKPRFEADLDWLAHEPLETFHQYSFATLRQFGACYELAATYLDWLRSHDVTGLDRPVTAFMELSTGAKTMQFQLARAMMRKKPLDLSPVETMATTWQIAVDDIKAVIL